MAANEGARIDSGSLGGGTGGGRVLISLGPVLCD